MQVLEGIIVFLFIAYLKRWEADFMAVSFAAMRWQIWAEASFRPSPVSPKLSEAGSFSFVIFAFSLFYDGTQLRPRVEKCPWVHWAVPRLGANVHRTRVTFAQKGQKHSEYQLLLACWYYQQTVFLHPIFMFATSACNDLAHHSPRRAARYIEGVTPDAFGPWKHLKTHCFTTSRSHWMVFLHGFWRVQEVQWWNRQKCKQLFFAAGLHNKITFTCNVDGDSRWEIYILFLWEERLRSWPHPCLTCLFAKRKSPSLDEAKRLFVIGNKVQVCLCNIVGIQT